MVWIDISTNMTNAPVIPDFVKGEEACVVFGSFFTEREKELVAACSSSRQASTMFLGLAGLLANLPFIYP